MKNTISKLLFVTIVISTFILVMPLVAGAQSVPWSTETYSVWAWGVNTGGYDSASGPPLPSSALVDITSGEMTEYAFSSATFSSLFIETGASGSSAHSTAYAGFTGFFTAANPYFILSYSYTESGMTTSNSGHIRIVDNTSSSILVSQGYNSSDYLTIPTTVGNDISVEFWIRSDVGVAMPGGGAGSNATLNYSMAVVPEPISSILFITGGVLLAGRRFTNKRRNGA